MRAVSPAVPLFFAAAGGALVGLLGLPADVPLLPLFFLSALVLGAALVARGVLARAALLLGVGFSVGVSTGAAQQSAAVARREALPGGPVVLAGVVADVGFTSTGGRRLDLDVDGVLEGPASSPRAASARVQVFVPPPVRLEVEPGDRVRARGLVRALLPAFSPGEFDARALGLARGVDGSLSVNAATDLAIVERGAARALFPRMRLALRSRMLELLNPHMAGLELALLVGDTSLFEPEQRELYRRVGAGHLLAVSGLQVSLIALLLRRGALAVLLATSLGRRGRLRAAPSLFALSGVIAFVLLCGAPPSAVRAAAMAGALLLADLFGRRARALDALGIAGVATVLLSPASVLDPSFLLSYAAVLGLAASTAPAPMTDDEERGRLKGVLTAIVTASVGAGLVTLPISAHLFGEVALAGLIANIVLVPAATILQVPALALGLLGALLDLSFVAWLGAQAALLLEALAAGLGDLLPGVRSVTAPSGALTLGWLACALAFSAALARRARGLGAASLAAAVMLFGLARIEPGGVRITVLPVGQGDGAVFEMPDGRVLLVDAGGAWDERHDPGADVVLPFLRRRGIEQIDVMILSHPHPDHALGLISVARALPVHEIWHNGAPPDGALLRRLLAAVPNARVRTTPALLGKHTFGGATVEVTAPAPAEGTALYPELGANDNSLVLRICQSDDCALWPGDLETLGEGLLLDSGAPVRAAVVKAAHHGSKTSSTPALVQASGASHVIFCTGPGNTFLFPHEEVLTRWRAAGARAWDTAVHGELTIHLTGAGVKVKAYVSGGEVVARDASDDG
jgi:competence protein ComEC